MSEVGALMSRASLTCTIDAALALCADHPESGDLHARLRSATVAAASLNTAEEIVEVAKILARLSSPVGDAQTRNAQIFAVRYGAIDIGERPTLEALAARFEMTHERVRQIISAMLAKLDGKTVWAPACRAAIEDYSYIQLESHLLYAFANFARDVLAIPVRVEKVKVRGRKVVSDSRVAAFTATANAISQRLIARNGAAQASLAYATAAGLHPDRAPPSFNDFYKALTKTPDLVWLDQDGGWYAFRDDLQNNKQNRTHLHLLKMLACAPKSLDVEEAFAQLGRYRYRERPTTSTTSTMSSIPFVAMNTSTLKALLMLLPDVQHTGHDDFALVGDKQEAREEYLSGLEKEIYNVMASNGGLASRAQVRRALVDTHKVGLPAFTTTWERSPIFAPVGHGICRIVGWELNVSALQEARCALNAECS